MTRLLHTADVHLRDDAPERLDALRRLLDRAEDLDVDAVTVGGDLFDRPSDVETLRTDLRNDLFSERPFRVLVIPGNHDEAAFRGDVFFGDACTVLAAEPLEHWTAPDGAFRVTGLPYRERPDDDLLIALEEREPFDGPEVLLLHCSLDAPFGDTGTGDEDTRRYFPVTEDLLAELDFDYYLAGHYHSAHEVQLPNGGQFTYPGTPASTGTNETGKRSVSLLEPATGVDFETLETFHYVHRDFTVTPGAEDALLDDVRAWTEDHVVPSANASVRVDGFVARPEDEFHEALADAASPASLTNDTRDVRHVLSRPLFRTFEDELDERDWDEETVAAVRERTLAVFSELAATGDI